MNPSRPLSRLLAGLAILVLGSLAAVRLPLTFEPATLFPELRLSLSTPYGSTADEPSQRAPRLAAVENAIRRSGELEHLSGQIGGPSFQLRIRYAPGTDIEAKATLLDSLLGDIRRHLPPGSALTVQPMRQRGGAAAFVIEVPRADPALLASIRLLPGVASARYSGHQGPELRLELPAEHPDAPPLDVNALLAPLKPRRLGTWPGPRRLELAAAPLPLEDLWLGPSRLGDQGRLLAHPGEPDLAARVDGRPAELLVVDRDAQASPLELKEALERELAASFGGGRFLRDESKPLGLLLRRLGTGLGVASLLLALLGLLLHSPRTALWQLLALPVGLAAALVALHLAGMSLDVLTLPPLFFAVLLALLPAALGRRGVSTWGNWIFAVAGVTTLPVALALLGDLGNFLGAPARVFVLAFAAAACVQLLLPPPETPRARAAQMARQLQAQARRQGAALLLATVLLVYVSWVFFADALWPRTGALQADLGDLAMSLELPARTSFAATEAEVQKAEALLGAAAGVARHFVIYRPASATFFIEMLDDWKSRERLAWAAERIEGRLQTLGLLARVQPLGNTDAAPPLRLSRGDEFRAETEVGTRTYRMLLRGRDFASVVAAEGVLQRFLKNDSIWISQHHELVPDWSPPTTTLELRPRSGVDRELENRARAALEQAFSQDSVVSLGRLPGQTSPLVLRLMTPGRSSERLQEPALEEVLQFLHAPGADLLPHFELVETLETPSLHWESGLFVLPLDLRIRAPGSTWVQDREILHDRLQNVSMPPGVELVLPRLQGQPFSERLHLLTAVALLPLLLLALLAMRLDSLWLALVALLPGAGALMAVAPLLAFQAGGNDEATLLGLAAALTGILPLAAFSAGVSRAREAPSPNSALSLWATRGHRELCRVLPAILPWLLATALVLGFTGFGLDAARQPWVKVLRVAGLALFAGSLLALFVSPALQVATERALRSFRKEERQRRREVADPPAWREEQNNVLEVRSLSKRYGNGFRALRKVDLRLEAGIVALLGPNGAGKTTLLRTLCGTLEPSRGQVLFRGQPVLPENLPVFRRRVGYLPQSFNAWDGLSAWRFLEYWSDVLGLPTGEKRQEDIGKALRSVGLEKMAKQAVRELSGGQRRRLGIARALLGEPPILIVDEPTTGLDVDARNQLRESLVALAGDRIVIFSTHIASDIAAVAKRVLLLDRGRLTFDGPPAELIAEARGRVFERLLREDELRTIRRNYQITTRIREPEGIRIRAVTHAGQEPAGDLVEPNLEEAYLARLGQGVRQRDERSWASLLDLESWRSR